MSPPRPTLTRAAPPPPGPPHPHPREAPHALPARRLRLDHLSPRPHPRSSAAIHLSCPSRARHPKHPPGPSPRSSAPGPTPPPPTPGEDLVTGGLHLQTTSPPTRPRRRSVGTARMSPVTRPIWRRVRRDRSHATGHQSGMAPVRGIRGIRGIRGAVPVSGRSRSSDASVRGVPRLVSRGRWRSGGACVPGPGRETFAVVSPAQECAPGSPHSYRARRRSAAGAEGA
jgi:hypothetical protein